MQNKCTINIEQPMASCSANVTLQIRTASLAAAIMAMMLCSDMLAGPLRYYLSHVGMVGLIYLPKAACLLFVFREIARRNIDRFLFYTFLFLLFYSGIGFIHQVNFKMQVFTLFSIAPFIFGISAARYLKDFEKFFVWLLVAIFIVTVAGVFFDVFWDFPWKGFEYKIEGATIEGSREGILSFGFERVAGFTRMAAAAAFYIMCTAVFLYSYCRSWYKKLLLALLAFPAIIATTNKASIVAFPLGIICIMLVNFPRVQKMIVYILVAMVMLLPVSTLVRNYELNLTDPVSVLLLASFEDRLINTWPSFFAAVTKFGNPLTGVGFGGAGSAVKYFTKGGLSFLSVADNFALYLYGCFGLAAVALFLYLAWITIALFSSPQRLTRSLPPVMVALFATSLTTDIIESQIFALMLGIAVALPSKSLYHSSSAIGGPE